MHRALDNYARGVFQPDDVRILIAAFDDAWRSILASGIKFESDRASEAVRDTLAKHIIEQARYGVSGTYLGNSEDELGMKVEVNVTCEANAATSTV